MNETSSRVVVATSSLITGGGSQPYMALKGIIFIAS